LNTPPTETDGPLGAFALARALVHLGCNVKIVSDECNEDVLMGGVCGIGEWSAAGRLTLESFPPEHEWEEYDAQRAIEIAESCSHIIAIERPGISADGIAYTMSGRGMNDLLAPLHQIINLAKEHNPNISVSAIGDGGNELGMGSVYGKILTSSIPHASQVASTVECDDLLVVAVSNWGGYALAAATTVCRYSQSNRFDENGKALSASSVISTCLPSVADEKEILQRIVDSGCRDGITGKQECTVDGLSLEENMRVLREITEVAGGVAVA
jgi:hypothetical protein